MIKSAPAPKAFAMSPGQQHPPSFNQFLIK